MQGAGVGSHQHIALGPAPRPASPGHAMGTGPGVKAWDSFSTYQAPFSIFCLKTASLPTSILHSEPKCSAGTFCHWLATESSPRGGASTAHGFVCAAVPASLPSRPRGRSCPAPRRATASDHLNAPRPPPVGCAVNARVRGRCPAC